MQKFLITIALISIFSIVLHGQSSDTSAINPELSKLINKALSLDSVIRNNPSMQTTTFNPQDSTSLPIGIVKEIGETKYIICIDSAYFTPEGAFFSVYMALDFPDSEQKVAFAAKDLQFNPKGVVDSENAKLQLISPVNINLGPKFSVQFKNDGKNYIEWDCNGYKQTSLSLDFIFNSESFINANNANQPITAGIEMVIQNLKDLTFTLSDMDPFRIKGMDEITFYLENISIDRSESTNPPGINLPSYTSQTLVGGIETWKGFYAQSARIKLPEKLSKDGQATEIYANNLIIDDAGLTGTIGATNIFNINNGGNASGWPFSLDNLELEFEANHLIAGSLSGSIGVPPLDDQVFAYSASIQSSTASTGFDYDFSISPEDNVSISAFSSTISLSPSSILEVSVVNNKFLPKATLHGDWKLNATKGAVEGIEFQSLVITNQAPFFQSGSFSLVSDGPAQIMRLPISIDNIGIEITPQSNLIFKAAIGLNLGGDGDESNSFSVNTAFQVHTKITTNPNTGKVGIKYDRFSIDDIGIDLNTSAFKLQGVIAVKNDDPVFGDLFYGSISLKINSFMDDPMMVSVGFGKMSDYKYWFFDAAVPVNIQIASGFFLTSLYGGAQNRVNSVYNTSELLDRVTGNISSTSNAIPFVPDNTKGLELRAGVGIKNTDEKLFHGEVVLAIAFNPNGGFASIDLNGRAFMMVNRSERDKNDVTKVEGQLAVGYNNNDKVLDATIDASIAVPSVLHGGLNIKLHISEEDWYFWLNRPSQRAYVTVVDILNANTYFMVGTQVDPIPSPPSYVTNLVGAGSLQNIDYSAVSTGGGFVSGMNFNIGFNGEFPKSTKWRGYVGLNLGGGFDAMLMKLSSTANCRGRSGNVGINNYYVLGQVYIYMNGSLGARKYKNNELKKTYSIGSLSMAALLQGKLPNPTFLYGAVGVEAQVLGIINFNFNVEMEIGTDCNLIY
ncbi:MAG TPA: hypothetical protein VKX35_08400 [Fermentimonas sp.]|nr:hypothetical protein [Fermentimonas sp.]